MLIKSENYRNNWPRRTRSSIFFYQIVAAASVFTKLPTFFYQFNQLANVCGIDAIFIEHILLWCSYNRVEDAVIRYLTRKPANAPDGPGST